MTFLRQLVDPVLKYTRKAFPLTLGGMDFSPLILLLGLNLLANFLQQAMLHLGNGLDPVKLIPIFILCLLNMVDSLSWLICLMMVARVIISLIDPSPYNPIVMLVYGLTEPLLTPLRNTFPRGPGGLDISAVVATVIIFIFNHFILLQLKMITTTWYYGNSIIRTPPLT
jgi:YggT family protein